MPVTPQCYNVCVADVSRVTCPLFCAMCAKLMLSCGNYVFVTLIKIVVVE